MSIGDSISRLGQAVRGNILGLAAAISMGAAAQAEPIKPSHENYGTSAHIANAAMARIHGQASNDAAVDKALAELHKAKSEDKDPPAGFVDIKLGTREQANLANAFLLNSPEAQKLFEDHVNAAYKRHFGNS